MNDLISRQATIDALEGRIKANGYSNVALVSELNRCIGYIMRLPPAQPDFKFDEWCTDCKEYDKERHCCPRWNRVIRDTLEDIQPETQWIPCSEETGDGYPEEDGLYYVTEQNYGFYLDAKCKQRVTHTSHFKNGDFTDRFYTENNSNITAWMPLPEPYKAESEDKK